MYNLYLNVIPFIKCFIYKMYKAVDDTITLNWMLESFERVCATVFIVVYHNSIVVCCLFGRMEIIWWYTVKMENFWMTSNVFFLHHNWCPFHKFKNITVNNVMLMLMTITKSCIRYDNFSLSKFTAMLIWHSKALGEFKIEKIYLETECKNWQTKTFFASRHFAYSTSIKIA